MITCVQKDEFWSVVEECLVKFHNQEKKAAHLASQLLREKIESPPVGISGDIFYHAEPFNVACDIAGKELPLNRFRKQYEQILSQHRW